MTISDTTKAPVQLSCDIEQIHNLWDTLADSDTSRVDETRTLLLEGLCKLVGAKSAALVGLVRMSSSCPSDALNGWRLRLAHHLYPTPELLEAARIQRRLVEEGRYDATVIANLRGAGVFRANRLCDLVPSEWFEGDYYRDWYLNLDRLDCVWVCVPVNEQVEIGYGIYRTCAQQPFTECERDTLAFALRGLRWLHRQQMLNYGLQLATDPLTDLEQRILALLLGGRADKQIAAELQQSPYTTQEYVARLLRKYGAPNRASLIALWLGKAS
ncbi:MAG: helix-turn-helix transcriptional regulator [Pseudohongiella sp.]|nr:helix-turn-helix transcriptional regulator [Pseudohongiella sp.]